MSGVKLTEACIATYQDIQVLVPCHSSGRNIWAMSLETPSEPSHTQTRPIPSCEFLSSFAAISSQLLKGFSWIFLVLNSFLLQKSKKHRYAVFLIQGGMIEVETVSRVEMMVVLVAILELMMVVTVRPQVGDRGNSYQDFLNDLHQQDGEADDCRYGVYDYDYQFNPDGAESTFKSKIFLMSW